MATDKLAAGSAEARITEYLSGGGLFNPEMVAAQLQKDRAA